MSAFGFGFALPLRRGRRGVAGFDFTAGVLPAGATLTRASVGTRFNSAGLLVSEAADVARFDHDPGSLALLGLLVERASTNLLLQSGPLNTGWIAQNTTRTSASDPEGGSNAARLDLSSASVQSRYQSVTATAGTSHAMSIFARRVSGATAARLTSNNGAAGTGMSGAVTLAAGWRRETLSGVFIANGSGGNFLIANYDAAGVVDVNARTVVDLYGAQLETGAATSWIPTTSAAATRAADALTLNWGAQGVADGAISVRYTFDDASFQDVAGTVAGGTAAVPTNLNRRWLRRADKL